MIDLFCCDLRVCHCLRGRLKLTVLRGPVPRTGAECSICTTFTAANRLIVIEVVLDVSLVWGGSGSGSFQPHSDMPLYILFESASGFGLFERVESEEIGVKTDPVQSSIVDLAKFSKLVKLVAFSPFTSAENALENINRISEGWSRAFVFNLLSLSKYSRCVIHRKTIQRIR